MGVQVRNCFAICLTLALLLYASGCDKLEAEVDKLRDDQEEAALKVKTVESFTVGNEQGMHMQIAGMVAPKKELALSFGASGKIAKIHVKKGDHVEAGALLASLDATVWEQEIAAAQGQVDSAQLEREKTLRGADLHDINQQKLEVERTRQLADQASAAYDRGKRLYANGAIAKDELEQLALQDKQAGLDLQEAQLRLTQLTEGADRLDLETANAAVKEANAQLAKAKQQLNNANIMAPFAGIVADLRHRESEQISQGEEVIRLVDTAQWIVELKVDQDQIGHWQAGKTVTVQSADGAQAEGTVSFVSPVLDKASGTYPVEIVLQDTALNWKGGMSVMCRYQVELAQGVLVPVSSVGIAEDGYYVLQVSNNSVKKVPVTVGALYDDYYQILDGLAAGDVIVKTGLSYLIDGEAVKVRDP
ncbi:efflux RND transporter periplasmic adaptor subunit [Brevibacillus fulvus]|uniref:Multidrug efflux pump subunit AcrA (Membrane-fusion protein) n=2 Tax=Brevibacillus fulvus TaxID=1125967 RepID=A0A938Y341_9BACL|nr:multidrug efflux pump subunit AcrA (membrane-fusion protein) [Brevibacillus fulvus]